MKTNNQNQVGSLHPSSTVLVSTASVALTLDALVTAGAVALVTLAFEVTAPWLKNVLETCVDVLKKCVGKKILKKCVEKCLKCLKDVEHKVQKKKRSPLVNLSLASERHAFPYLALASTDSCSVVTVCPTDTLANDVVKLFVRVTNLSSSVPSNSAIK